MTRSGGLTFGVESPRRRQLIGGDTRALSLEKDAVDTPPAFPRKPPVLRAQVWQRTNEVGALLGSRELQKDMRTSSAKHPEHRA